MGDILQAVKFASPNSSVGPSTPAILASAATGIVDHICEQGGDIDSIFGNSGLAPSMAGETTLQLKLSSFCRLFEEAARRTENQNFGLWFGNQFKPQDLGLWGYVGVTSPTLGAALENLVSYFPYHQENSMLNLRSRNDGMMMFEYQITAPEIVERRQDAELSLGMFLNVFRECLGQDWTPEEVYFEHPKPEAAKAHENAFGAAAYFSQPVNALVFKPEILDHPMPSCDLALMTMMQTCLAELGSGRDGFESVTDRVRSVIRMKLPEGCPSLEIVGEALQLSSASIQRELSLAGLTYKELIQATRYDLAHAYLKQRHLPLSEIAFLLGYSELSAFSRAVRRWTGESPRAMRRRLIGS
ncbi:MAG: AraC family transcriptional regulator [Rhodospirillaceae bacterium]|jgi:AraC-like DNA-binding protein|nr:AraC family transcriptional regulator [Rhodospirillaceae bacterium]MBT5245136.1 AraC family transcriptional regulator [Rhodospirillaceae bacterium]MBT5561999.1 AraC family transcriptional regulator [Rhodospirillaceae bacterium]MBT6242172.1 AraC family transcriptional regulator [Rhodospirillaceae bacterium]MBT7136641.1 AraC family transcriptional regulator [Rhodospirillaceae bacterium]